MVWLSEGAGPGPILPNDQAASVRITFAVLPFSASAAAVCAMGSSVWSGPRIATRRRTRHVRRQLLTLRTLVDRSVRATAPRVLVRQAKAPRPGPRVCQVLYRTAPRCPRTGATRRIRQRRAPAGMKVLLPLPRSHAVDCDLGRRVRCDLPGHHVETPVRRVAARMPAASSEIRVASVRLERIRWACPCAPDPLFKASAGIIAVRSGVSRPRRDNFFGMFGASPHIVGGRCRKADARLTLKQPNELGRSG